MQITAEKRCDILLPKYGIFFLVILKILEHSEKIKSWIPGNCPYENL